MGEPPPTEMPKRKLETPQSPAERMRKLLEEDKILVAPACYDALSAKLVARAGFELTFMTGFGVAAVHGYPDTQLLSYGEMLQSATDIGVALNGLPCIGDGDTGCECVLTPHCSPAAV